MVLNASRSLTVAEHGAAETARRKTRPRRPARLATVVFPLHHAAVIHLLLPHVPSQNTQRQRPSLRLLLLCGQMLPSTLRPLRTAPEAEYICPAGFLRGWPVGVELVDGLPERPGSQQRHFLQASKDVFVCSVLIYVQRIRGFTTMRYINLRFTYLLTYSSGPNVCGPQAPHFWDPLPQC